jgi:type I restriction enzyme, S subunit
VSEENGLPRGWEATTVGELCKIMGGGTPSTDKEAYWKGTVPWMTSADIADVRDVRFRRAVTPQAIEDSAANVVPAGSVIVATRVGLGKVALAPADLSFSQDCQGLVFDTNSIDGPYLAYELKTAVQMFKHISRGTTISGVTKKQLVELPVLLAPLPEQTRIVAKIEELFSELGAAVASLQRVQANLKRYRAAVLKAAVEGKLTKAWRAEHPSVEPASVLLERILKERRRRWEEEQLAKFVKAGKTPPQGWQGKYREPLTPSPSPPGEGSPSIESPSESSAGHEGNQNPTTESPAQSSPLPRGGEGPGVRGDLPEGWCWTTVEQVSSLVTDGDHNPPPRHAAGVPHLTARNVVNSRLDFSACTFVSERDAERVFQRYRPHPGDLIVTCVGTVGRTALVPDGVRFSPDRNLAAIRPLLGGSFGRWLEIALTSPASQQMIARLSGSTAQPHLYLSHLRAFRVPLPSIPEQHQIVAEVDRRLSAAAQVEAQVEASLKRATALRQSILKRAFEGKLVPQDPNDEPASVLLERIHQQRAQVELGGGGRAGEGRRIAAGVALQRNLFED